MLTFLVWYLAATNTGTAKDMFAGLAILGTFSGFLPGIDICLIIYMIKGLVTKATRKPKRKEPDTRSHLDKCRDAYDETRRKPVWEESED